MFFLNDKNYHDIDMLLISDAFYDSLRTIFALYYGVMESKLLTFEKEDRIDEILSRYPENSKRSAIIPLLDIAQRRNGGWLSCEAIKLVADTLNLSENEVYSIASFYSMFHMSEVGKYVIYVCCTTPCWLRKSDEILVALKSRLNIDFDETTQDGLFTLKRAECLGACVDAPVIAINDDVHERLTSESVVEIIDSIYRKNSSLNQD